jgi:hypothetical protein
VHGALSCAHWLNWRIGLDLGAARERVRVARALGSSPVLDDALRRGMVSYSKIRAMTRVASPDNESSLLEMARHATASQLEKICRGYRRALVNREERPESLGYEELRRFVCVRDTEDGMVCVEARLRPEEAAVVLQVLDAARRRAWRARDAADGEDGRKTADSDAARVSAETSSDASRVTSHEPRSKHEPRTPLARADALVAVAEAYLRCPTSDAQATTETAAAAPTPVALVIHVDEAALGVDSPNNESSTEHHAMLEDGTAVSLATAQRLACDAYTRPPHAPHLLHAPSRAPSPRRLQGASKARRSHGKVRDTPRWSEVRHAPRLRLDTARIAGCWRRCASRRLRAVCRLRLGVLPREGSLRAMRLTSLASSNPLPILAEGAHTVTQALEVDALPSQALLELARQRLLAE